MSVSQQDKETVALNKVNQPGALLPVTDTSNQSDYVGEAGDLKD